jgi:cation diffusion facilitator CzcD-associated flavoprotein CzcO
VSPHAEPPRVDAPRSFARLLVEQELAGASGHEIAAVSLLVERVHVGLARWFGPFGALALMTRAITRARVDHPVLANVVASATTPHVTGWSQETTADHTIATSDAVITVLTCLHETLTRLIGDDLAETLLSQSAVPTVPSTTEMPVSPNASDE